MKPFSKPACRLQLLPASAAFVIFTCLSASAASDSWIVGTNGSYAAAANWTGGNVPNGATDVATIEGVGSVVAFNQTVTLQALNLALSTTGATPTFTQTGGSLGVGTLAFGGGGQSRNPTYNMNGGVLNISTSFAWSNGNNARFNQSAGTVDHSGTTLNLGSVSGSRSYITMTGGTFNANSVLQINLGNTGSGNGQAYVDLSGDSVFNATSAAVVVGQFGASSGTNSFANLSLAGNSQLNASTVVVGGNNAGSSVFGVVNLNGGTISAGSIRKGSSTIASSITQNVLHANGGTVRATNHANNANYFQNLFVDIQSGGLVFDTNGNDVGISTGMSGDGGLTKTGEGTLTLSGTNTYGRETTVSAGRLAMSNATLDDDSPVTVETGALLTLTHGAQDQVSQITLGGTTYTEPGTYGSSNSPAIYQNDEFFEGEGMVRIGPASPGRNLIWTGATDEVWAANGVENFVVNGNTPAAFNYNDQVTFDGSSTVTTVNLVGMVYPGAVTFSGSQNLTLQASSPAGIAGETGIVINNSATTSLGGTDSTFTGPIAVNAGVLVALDNKSFGASSGIEIASGAQVDLNGKSPGPIHTYTLNGAGPGGAGAIVNSSTTDLFSSGGVKHLILAGDATIGSNNGRFDIGGGGGSIVGNARTLTKVGSNSIAFRGSMNTEADGIAIVVAGGAIWAEGNASAFCGANGTLTIESGAAAGTFGSNLSIATPVTIKDGGTLRSGTFGVVSALTGTWTSPVTVEGDVTLSGLGGPLILAASLSGTANITKDGANNVTLAEPSHAGNTTVAVGTLTVGTASLDDEGDIVVATGAVLNLTHAETDVVDTLLLGVFPATPGTWGSSASAAVNKNDTYFQGTGVLDVQNTAVAPSGYDAWISGYALQGDDRLPDADPDRDGLENAVERILGSNPTASSQDGRPSGSKSGSNLVFTFSRTDASETPDNLLEVEYGNNLTGWTAVTIGPESDGIVTVQENGGDADLITVTIPEAGDTRKFVRLKVTVTD